MKKEEVLNLLNEKVLENNVKDAMKAIQKKGEEDETNKSNLEVVKNIIGQLAENNNETVIDTMLCCAVILPPILLNVAIDTAKKMAVVKMLEDLESKAKEGNDPMAGLAALAMLGAMAEKAKKESAGENKGSDLDIDKIMGMFK